MIAGLHDTPYTAEKMYFYVEKRKSSGYISIVYYGIVSVYRKVGRG